MLVQYGLIKYVSASTALVAAGTRNENTKRQSANTVMRSGNEKNAPIILLIQVFLSV